MLSFKKLLVIAGLLGAGLIGTSATEAQAGGYGHFYRHHYYAPVYKPVIVRPYVLPTYHYVLPSYNFCY